MIKRIAALALVLLLTAGLAACGGEVDSSSQSTVVSSAPPVASSVPQPQPEPEPIPEPVENDRAFLTGLQKDAKYPQDKRITAVMVNNIASSRPLSGVAQAKVLVEIKVEGGITRFMALFDDYAALPKVGSVRSARDQFFQLLLPYWGFYVHDGPNEEAHPLNLMLGEYEYHEFDLQQGKGATFFTDRPGYVREHTEYTDAEHMLRAIEESSASDYRSYGGPIFDFVHYNESPRMPTGGTAYEVAVVHSPKYRSFFEYETGKYKMSMYNTKNGKLETTVDEASDTQLEFDNLVILFAPMELYADSDLVRVDYSIGGGGYYFSQGRYEPIVWNKGAPNQALNLYSRGPDGETTDRLLKVNTGTTYIAVADEEELHGFNLMLLDGGAREIAEGGVMDPNQKDTTD